MRKLFILSALLLLTVIGLRAQETAPQKGNRTITFVFAPGKDMFILKGNEAELKRLYSLIDEYRSEISSGTMPIYVDAYCTSLPTDRENLRTAFIRANRVKSELITQKGLTEANFITANYTKNWQNRKDMVIVTLRIPAQDEPKQTETVEEQSDWEETTREVAPRPEPTVKEESKPVAEAAPKPAIPGKNYNFAVRTNALYDALLLPTLGVEWRINRDYGIRLDGSLSWWGGEHGKVQKMWLLNPEIRRYLLANKRFYIGVAGNYGEYNIYKYIPGSLMKDDTGYQGKLWSAGLTVGYQLHLSHCFSVDFNLGLGYTRSKYDSFTMTDGTRVSKERNRSKNLWGPTQAGISLVWTIGGKKQ